MQDCRTDHAIVSLKAFEQQIFTGLRAGEMNACTACCDRWADGNRVALEWFDSDRTQVDHTYLALQADAARFANLLTTRGVRPGDVVAGLLPRGAELLTVVLGTWRAGAVFLPISTGFGPTAMERRINASVAKLVVTDVTNRLKLDQVAYCPPVLVVTNGAPVEPGDGDFRAELACQSVWFPAVPRRATDPFVVLFTGDPGCLRPVTLPLGSLLVAVSSLQVGIDPREAGIGWDVADPSWSFGLYFAVMQPLLLGQAATAYETDSMPPPVNRASPVQLRVCRAVAPALPSAAAPQQHAEALLLAA